ncbi:MAG: peptide chain release factor N(5)-glutamine methyltransferase [Rickettsiaceae bacterium]
MQIQDALIGGLNNLKQQNIDTAYTEVTILLQHALKKNLEYLLLYPERMLSEQELCTFEDYIKRRMKFEPISYIVGTKEFYDNVFKISDEVLIPRPETETLIDAILSLKELNTKLNILELGVGSGCIVITLMLKYLHWKATALDISRNAINIAKTNAQMHGVDKRIAFVESDWFQNISGKFDLIISNPPYVDHKDTSMMSCEVLMYEPREALFADQSGLSSYCSIFSGAKKHLNKNGYIVIEIGYNQLDPIKHLMNTYGFITHAIFKDLDGWNRVLVCKT